jgi:hypothetical protein
MPTALFVCVEHSSQLGILQGLVLQGNKAETMVAFIPRGFFKIINQMNTHDFCGTDLVAGLLPGTLHRSAK